MRGGIHKIDRRRKLHLLMNRFVEGAIVAAFIYLIVNTVSPVVVGNHAVQTIYIAVYKELSPHMPHRIPTIPTAIAVLAILRGADVDGGNTLLHSGRTRLGAGTWLVIIIDDIYIHTFAAITTTTSPIVNNVVAHIHTFVCLRTLTRSETRRTAVVMSHQIVMITGSRSAPIAAITMRSFAMSCIIKTLRRNTPLHRDIVRTIHRQTFIDTPTDRTMVDNDVYKIHATQAIALVISHISISQTETHITDNHIVSTDGERIIGHTDTIAGSRLSGQSDITVSNAERTFQMNGSRHIENNGTRAALIQTPTQRTLTRCSIAFVIVFERVHHINFTTTTTGSVTTKTFCTGKSRHLFRLQRNERDENHYPHSQLFHKNLIFSC